MIYTNAKTDKEINFPNSWEFISRNSIVQKKIKAIFSASCQTLYGDFLLKIGPLSAQLQWQEHGLRNEIVVQNSLAPYPYLCVGDYLKLPFQAHAIDAIVACHGFDFSADPHQQLREYDRVLRSDGYLFMTGINPFSLSGLAINIPGLYRHHPFKKARCFASPRIKDWLSILGFECRSVDFIAGHNLLSTNQKDGDISQMRSSIFNGLYVIVAQKRETPLNLVNQRPAKVRTRLHPVAAQLRK